MDTNNKFSGEDSDHYKTIQQFRKNIKDVLKPYHTDGFLLNYLKVKNFNLKKAEKMIRTALSMRSLYGMETFVTDYKVPEIVKKYGFLGFLGFDKEGSPVRYIHLGLADLIGFVMSMTIFEIGCYCEYAITMDHYYLEQENKRTGRSVTRCNYIFDMADFSLQQVLHKPALELGLDLIRIYQDLRPDDVKAIYCINAPVYFYVAYNAFKPILRINLLQRIHVFSKDQSPEKLLKVIDAEVLPKSLGGSRLDPDGNPTCRTIIQYGGKVAEEFYKSPQDGVQESDPGAKILAIPARSCYNMGIPIGKAGSVIRMEFRTENYSIGLNLRYKPLPSEYAPGDNFDHLEVKIDNDEEVEVLSCYARIQSHMVPIDQTFYCYRPGLYIFHFDNTFSLLNSKRLIYRYEVTQPED